MRLFVGLEFPPSLQRVAGELRGSLPDVVWYPPDSYHLTLHFMGEITQRPVLEDIHHALAAIRAPHPGLRLTAPGLFESETRYGPDTLWIGLAADPVLVQLQHKIRATLNRILPTPARRGRRFVPHVTLGQSQRTDSDQRQRWLATPLPASEEEHVGHFTLFQSLRRADGPFYEPLEHYPLAP
ncbi:RNA 2',3'-cyclic phosphodiesterase [Komagataeibacter sp. FNDCR2]|uniref:RNA 2',3'-cyclic phosphodiesterase n=1 Tax=Komagataeibacter sp. FNDCR2 TaxID=2878682 RepID=UPI001E4DB29F|nr:RNA 2',3'-cyclic phosphodiesterase [Komagataeibacter sp. FNDCR2]MCE2576451.1 RNA 2',3'-cyclic phosphodiesterase [Komagataeibacter sp. FNDCR2]